MCEWILILALLKILLRILSEWFPKHLEISLGAIPRGFESHPLRHVGASYVSLAPTFFKSQSALTPLLLLSKSQPLTLGCDLGPPLRGGFFLSQGNIDFNRPFHVGAKSALLRRLFMPVAKKTSSARSLAPPFQLRPAALGSQLVCCPAGHIPISAAPHESASGARGKVHNFCMKSSAISWAIRLLDRRFFSVINCEASSSSNAWKALCHTGAAFREPAGGASR